MSDVVSTQSSAPNTIPGFPLFVSTAMVVGLGLSYFVLQLPHSRWVMLSSLVVGGIIALFKLEFPAFFFPSHTNWPILFLIPFCGLIAGFGYGYTGLPGGIFVQIALVLGSFGLSILLNTNLFVSSRNGERSLLWRLMPLSSICFGGILLVASMIMGRNRFLLYGSVATILIYPILYIVLRLKHYPILALSSMLLGMWPLLFRINIMYWITIGLGFALIVLAFFRTAKDNLPSVFPATAIYVTGFIYIIWLILSLMISPIATSGSSVKVVFCISQLVFLFGMLQNMRSKEDLYSVVLGYLIGASIVIGFLIFNTWQQITHFNPIVFLFSGIRITVIDQNPNAAIPPALTTLLFAFAFFINKRGLIQYAALFVVSICLFLLFLSGSRSSQIAFLVVGVLFTAREPKWRKFTFGGLAVLVVLITAAYIINPEVTKILTRARNMDSGRLELWRGVWEMIQRRPLFGFGPDAGRVCLPQYINEFTTTYLTGLGGRAHNIFFSEIIESGFVGFLLLSTIYFFMWRWLKRIPNRESSPWKFAAMSIFIAYTFRGLFQSDGILFIHSVLGECYPPLLALIVATGDVLPDTTDKSTFFLEKELN